jgi:hypothetical protein
MTLLQATLASELEAMVPVEAEAQGIDNFSNAFEMYFYDASVLGVPCAPTTLAAAAAALKSAMVGISSTGTAAIQAGIVAFWGVIATSTPTIWPGSLSATPPPGLSGIAAALQTVFTANTAGGLDLAASAAAVAAALHPTQLGGFAVQPTPAPPAPIL